MAETEPRRRKGAVRRADIPADVLKALNTGHEETITLVEWLAIDMPTLLNSILPAVGLASERYKLVTEARRLAQEGVMLRLKGIGAALLETTRYRPDREEIFEALATYGSDMVRAWSAFMIMADTDLDLADRLDATKRFAADPAVSVRETAWASFRPYIIEELDRALLLLGPWVHDADPNIRRCAIEGTRPRGVWASHIEALKADPMRGLPLLEPVRSDSSRFVARAVANWLNDASKSRPDWVLEFVARWEVESPTDETRWIINHATRTLRKRTAAGTVAAVIGRQSGK